VRIVAAEALGRLGDQAQLGPALEVLGELGNWGASNVFVAMSALGALDALGDKAQVVRARLRQSARQGTSPHARYGEYVPRLLDGAR
jgi:HEAT repeat protein